MIPYAHQDIDEADIAAVAEVLRSDFITQGPAVPKFEKAVADYCGAKYAVAVNSGTSALHIACQSIGLGHGDMLWTSPNTFAASANCALYCGAAVDFVDIDPKTYNISVDKLYLKLKQADKVGRLPKAVIPVHFAGQSCQMADIAELAKQYHFIIIEDACHAIGGTYKNSKIGSGMYADMTVFSFHPVKIITTGEGGMVVTNTASLYEKLSLMRNHGITRDPLQMTRPPHGSWYYEQIDLGCNYRMTDIQAALGASQMGRIDEFVKNRREIAVYYDKHLSDLPVITPYQSPECQSAWHLYVICLEIGQIKKSRREVFDLLRAAGIGVNVHYIPVHTHPYYQNTGFAYGNFPEAESYYERAVSLPIYSGLRTDQQDYIIDTLKRILE